MTDITIAEPVKNRHVTGWLIEFDPSARGDDEYALVYSTECVKAACKSGLIIGLNVDEVDDLPPYKVNELAGLVVIAANEAMKPPKKKT